MTSPISDFVKKYAASEVSRFHMPGHKGHAFLGCENLDITEIDGADVLSSASGIIAESEANSSALFGSAQSFYSTEGSTLLIKTMLALIKKKAQRGERVKILAARNVHKSFIYACALLDLDVEWIYPTDLIHPCECKISENMLELALNDSLPAAVYITSPDYLGNVADIEVLSNVCHKHEIPLLVDNAHGAYLAFLEPSKHPLALGADMCCDSAHKTLPVLTGGAYLHISKNYNIFPTSYVRDTLSIFASTSPSYLILQSLDLCNAYLAEGYRDKLSDCVKNTRELKNRLAELGFAPLCNTEELKIALQTKAYGYYGNQLADELRKYKIEVEFADSDMLVLMITPELSKLDFDRVLAAFKTIRPLAPIIDFTPPSTKPKKIISIREAIFSDNEAIPSENSSGRICASPTISCPPAVPIVMSGELIDDETSELLSYYGIKTVNVIK